MEWISVKVFLKYRDDAFPRMSWMGRTSCLWSQLFQSRGINKTHTLLLQKNACESHTDVVRVNISELLHDRWPGPKEGRVELPSAWDHENSIDPNRAWRGWIGELGLTLSQRNWRRSFADCDTRGWEQSQLDVVGPCRKRKKTTDKMTHNPSAWTSAWLSNVTVLNVDVMLHKVTLFYSFKGCLPLSNPPYFVDYVCDVCLFVGLLCNSLFV